MKNIKVSFDTWVQLLGMLGVLRRINIRWSRNETNTTNRYRFTS